MFPTAHIALGTPKLMLHGEELLRIEAGHYYISPQAALKIQLLLGTCPAKCSAEHLRIW